ncbi:MAG: hypothetical protein Fur0035_03470 [Anaerolineales bacterium]
MTENILITGAGRGIGRQLALTFAAQGYSLALNDISPINVEEVAAQIGGGTRVFVQDISKKVTVQALANEISDELGALSAVIHCARVEPRAAALEMDEWDLHRVFEVNTIGTFLMIQTFGRMLRPQGGGVFLSVFPLAGRETGQAAAFLASQMALPTLIRSAAPELAAAKVRLYGLTSGLPQTLTDAHSFADLPSAALALCRNPNFSAGSVFGF